jgi:CHAD domain-containing protein
MTLSSLDESWARLFSRWTGAGKGKAKAVHDFRVASRRIGASLEILASLTGDNGPSRVRRRLKKLVRRLGALRDVQVLIILVQSGKLGERVASFERYLKGREKEEKRRIQRALNDDERRKLKTQWNKLRNVLSTSDIQTSDQHKAVQSAIELRSNRLRAAVKDFDTDNLDSAHKVRIALKKLRYTLESAASHFGARRQQEKTAAMVKQQRELGDIRDLDVLRRQLVRWSTGQKANVKDRIHHIDVKLRKEVHSRLEAFSRQTIVIR